MIWALGLIAPFFAFVALLNFRVKVKRRALCPVQVEDKPRDETHPVATPNIPEAAAKTAPVAGESSSPFDQLRGAMERGNENLFIPLQTALVELVRVSHSLEVCTLDLRW